jgi:hypothetical protein
MTKVSHQSQRRDASRFSGGVLFQYFERGYHNFRQRSPAKFAATLVLLPLSLSVKDCRFLCKGSFFLAI